MCVFLCLGDYQWLGVWCVWLGDCFWVSLCVCLSVYVFVIMCVYIYFVYSCVFDKLVIPYCLTKTSLCALCTYVSLFPFLSGSHFFLVFLSVSVCTVQWLLLPLICNFSDHKAPFFFFFCGNCKADHSSDVYVQMCCFLSPAVCVFMCCGGQECGGTSRGAVINSLGLPCRGLWD